MLLYVVAAAVPLSVATWRVQINHFAVEQASFTGSETGILQRLRKVAGFLAIAAVLLLLFFH